MPYNPPDTVSLWCSAGNAQDERKKHPERSLALVPCTAPACPEWDDGRCGHIERVGKTGRV